ncbi:hypothetical protein GF402_10845 [Candidatus Fermentibacteria bacterium]|nr:hypothetical protein [Candidatus Fermentibacteria bacterium]
MIPEGAKPSGYAGLVGPSNAGRSSLLNSMTGKTISPVNAKPGTTRVPLTGLCLGPGFQICLVDAPPIERTPQLEMYEWLDLVCLVLDARRLEEQLDMPGVKKICSSQERPLALALTFLDYFPKRLHGAFMNQATVRADFAAVFGVCPPTGKGVDRLRSWIIDRMPRREALFPDRCSSLHSERFLVSEQIRTQLYNFLPWQIADHTAVQVQEFSFRDGKTYVRANLHVAKHSSKGIVIGRKGLTLKSVAEEAGEQAERMLGRKVRLDLWVKVREGWPQTPEDLLEFGYVC